MADQPRLLLDDAESVMRRETLSVVHAQAESVAMFGSHYFSGFDTFRGLTYSSSMPMVAALLAEHDFDDFECVFGHPGILPPEAEDILAFQAVVRDELEGRLFRRKGISDARRRRLYDCIEEGTVRFFVVKDAIAHAKIYLLSQTKADAGCAASSSVKRRVIAGSANLSERAFSGRQAETLIVFDDDEMAWKHYASQYEAVRDASTSRLPVTDGPPPVEKIRIERTPTLVEAEESPNGTTLYVPTVDAEEGGIPHPALVTRMEAIRPAIRRGMAGVSRPDRTGHLRLTPRIAKEIVQVVRSRQAEAAPTLYLSRSRDGFTLNGAPWRLTAEKAEVSGDVEGWLAFFTNYERGFVGDVERLQRDYFTFMCWFYFAPLMCDLRNAALRRNAFSFDQPMFAVLYGSSNCGKTSLIETLMASMFTHPRIVDTQDFTPGKLRGLQDAYKRFPVVFDDVTRDRFNRYADEIVKDESIAFAESPCFALSMNADARSFKAEIVKRCLMIYTRTSLPGDDTVARRRLQQSVAAIRDRISTALYRHYLTRILPRLDAEVASSSDDREGTDAFAAVVDHSMRDLRRACAGRYPSPRVVPSHDASGIPEACVRAPASRARQPPWKGTLQRGAPTAGTVLDGDGRPHHRRGFTYRVQPHAGRHPRLAPGRYGQCLGADRAEPEAHRGIPQSACAGAKAVGVVAFLAWLMPGVHPLGNLAWVRECRTLSSRATLADPWRWW